MKERKKVDTKKKERWFGLVLWHINHFRLFIAKFPSSYQI